MGQIEIIVRSAEKRDWESVWHLLESRGATDNKEKAQDRFYSLVQNRDHFLPVAFDHKQAIGYGWVQDYGLHLRTGKKLCRFHDLFVLTEHRNKGVAAKIFDRVKSWAEESGASWLQWNANPTSSSFYEKLGYTPIPEEEEGFPFFEITFKE